MTVQELFGLILGIICSYLIIFIAPILLDWLHKDKNRKFYDYLNLGKEIKIMTQENKQLILQEICARLPYEPIVYWENCNYGDKVKNVVSVDIFGIVNDEFSVEECKLYLRPMSSMTEEENEQRRDLWIDADTNTHAIRLIDFYNKYHFDYRGLIDKGLAISTKEYNPYKD